LGVDKTLQKAVEFTIASGYQLDREAFDFLSSISQTEDPIKLLREAIRRVERGEERPLFIKRSVLEETAEELFLKTEEAFKLPPIPTEAKGTFKAYAKEVSSELKVIENPAEKISATGSIEDYLEHFRDRFKKLQRLLRRRIDTRDVVTIKEARKALVNTKLKIIAMVTEKREVKQKIVLRVEDLEASASVLVPKNATRELVEKARKLLLDQVVCINVTKGRNNLLIAEEIVWPDIPQRTPKTASEPVFAALISDLHVGSKMFMHEELSRFILWLNGKYGNTAMKEIAGRVKYLVVAGDIVDGIGVYPNQIKELAVPDVYKQYELAAGFFEQIPDYIEVIIIPGNHDACRKALPQPAIEKDYAEPIYEARKVHSLGNPCAISLHGVEFLLYHGRSLDDVIVSSPNVGFQDVEKAMRLLLQCRHLAPIYGGKTPIAPEHRDFLVIERPPDVFHAGHVHVVSYETYRGTLIVNSGAWQRQTAYQKKMGLEPTPGVIPLVDLQTLKVRPVSFVAGAR